MACINPQAWETVCWGVFGMHAERRLKAWPGLGAAAHGPELSLGPGERIWDPLVFQEQQAGAGRG